MAQREYHNVAIIGDGGMGTVLAILLCRKGITTRMWGYDAEQLGQTERHRENRKFLPGYELPDSLIFDPRDEQAMVGAKSQRIRNPNPVDAAKTASQIGAADFS